MASKNSFTSWRKGFFTGAITGTVLGLLFAPKAGREIRKALLDTSRQAYGTGEKVIEPAKKATSAVIGLKGRRGKEEKERVEEAAEKIEEAAA